MERELKQYVEKKNYKSPQQADTMNDSFNSPGS